MNAGKWQLEPGKLVLPRSEEGEWYELWSDEHNLPYYFQTRTSETSWYKPDGFVIPLKAVQVSYNLRRIFLSRRLMLPFRYTALLGWQTILAVFGRWRPAGDSSSAFVFYPRRDLVKAPPFSPDNGQLRRARATESGILSPAEERRREPCQ